jgi:hypothetical protein
LHPLSEGSSDDAVYLWSQSRCIDLHLGHVYGHGWRYAGPYLGSRGGKVLITLYNDPTGCPETGSPFILSFKIQLSSVS